MPVAEHRQNSRRYSHDDFDDTAYAPSSSSSEEILSEKGSTNYSSSRRVLAHVLARKERDAKQMAQLLRLSFAKLDQESQRAVDAERRAAECLVRARAAIDARALAEAEAARFREELGMYKVQLEQAQREIFRAQEVVDSVEARRREAEEDAVRARGVARKLQEQRAVESAREQGRKEGMKDGMDQGYRMGWERAMMERRARDREDRMRAPRTRRGLEDALFSEVDDEPQEARRQRDVSSDDSSLVNIPSRGIPEADNGAVRYPDAAPIVQAPPVPTLTTPFRSPSPSPQPSPELRYPRASSRPRLHTPDPYTSHHQPRHRTPEPRYPAHAPSDHAPPVSSRPYTPGANQSRSRSRPYTPHESAPSIIHPVPARNASPTVQHRPVSVPPDGWIPTAQDQFGDGRLSIVLPPPHEMKAPLDAQSFVIAETPEGGSPAIQTAPVPPPGDVRRRDYAYGHQQPAPVATLSAVPQRIGKAYSQNSRASTHLSEYELLAPVDGPRAQGTMGPPPAEEDELEYIDPPQTPIRQIPSAGPSRSSRPRHVYDENGRKRGPTRPREIVFPAPLGQAVEQLAQQPPPAQRAQPVYSPPSQDSDSSPPIERGRSRPHRSRTASSGVIGITVEPPSPGNSPPTAPDDDTLVNQPNLLSPEHANRPLSASDHISASAGQARTLTPLTELPNLPPGFIPSGSSSSSATVAPPQPRARSRTPAYEAAPIPPGVQYPASPIASHGTVRRKAVPQEPEVGPLSPLSSSSGFLGFLPGKLPWRRNTTDK